MSSEEFWKDTPDLFLSYRTSFLNKKKKEMEETNFKCWLQGLYLHDGNSVLNERLTVSISRMLGGKGKFSEQTYPKQPHDLFKENEEKTIEKEKEKKHNDYFKSFNYFASIKQKFKEKIKKGE